MVYTCIWDQLIKQHSDNYLNCVHHKLMPMLRPKDFTCRENYIQQPGNISVPTEVCT